VVVLLFAPGGGRRGGLLDASGGERPFVAVDARGVDGGVRLKVGAPARPRV